MRLVSLSNLQRIGLLTTTVAMLAIALAPPRFAILPILVVLLSLLLLATSASHAGRLSESLRAFQNRPVEIRIWGEPLPPIGGSSCQIESIRALGAGLHLFVKSGDGPAKHLKIAQPRGTQVTERSAEIHEAAYVQWVGKKQARVEGTPALKVTTAQ